MIRAVGAGREGHWSGFIAEPVTFVMDPTGIVRWVYTGDGSASDRPSPVALAKTAVAIAQGKESRRDNQAKP
ncbi:MAG: hypothetical protein HY694_03390 [Deltaproteobacteria bacterium]|nr:hypothetical protein [Deltaproteobacteria bacterium]